MSVPFAAKITSQVRPPPPRQKFASRRPNLRTGVMHKADGFGNLRCVQCNPNYYVTKLGACQAQVTITQCNL